MTPPGRGPLHGASGGRLSAAFEYLVRCRLGRATDKEKMRASCIGAKHLEFDLVDLEDFGRPGYPTEFAEYESDDRVEVAVRDAGSEGVVEMSDLGQCGNPVPASLSWTIGFSPSSKSYSSSMSPTICSRTSSIVISPATPPY